MFLPEQEGATGTRAQQLLGGPKHIGSPLGTDPKQSLRRDTPVGQGQGQGCVRRRQQRDGALAGGQQGWAQKAKLPHPRLLH